MLLGRITVAEAFKMTGLPITPPILKAVQPYMKIALEHDNRDPVVAYWCRIYALQAALKIDRKSKESVQFLTAIMDWLETAKKNDKDNEAISNEVVAQAHIENYALKLFLWADAEDRKGNFNKNVVKSFFTAGVIYDVLQTFGDLTDEVLHHRKYAKWKATYIHNCLKNGITPQSGPISGEGEETDEFGGKFDTGGSFGENSSGVSQSDPRNIPGSSDSASFFPPLPHSYQPNVPSTPPINSNGVNSIPSSLGIPTSGVHAPPSTPSGSNQASPSSSQINYGPAAANGIRLNAEELMKAQKFCKFAGSALQYEDIPTAIDNLQKALLLLTTGKAE